MKRVDLIRQIEKSGCVFIRHGGRHDWYQNPRTGSCQPLARHREIKDHLAKHILRKLVTAVFKCFFFGRSEDVPFSSPPLI